jgi:hypothetical protein
LRARKKNHAKSQARAALREGVDSEEHGENFEELRADRHGSFTETVRQIAARH